MSLLGVLRALAVALLALLLVAGVWWVARGGDGGEGEAEVAAMREVGLKELREAAASSEAPIYWVGERPGTRLELREEGEGNRVRYLTGAAAGGRGSPSLQIGTYRLPIALSTLEANAKRAGVNLRKTPDGAFAWVDQNNPTRVYLARPGEKYQVEISAADPKSALRVARSPRLRPVAGS